MSIGNKKIARIYQPKICTQFSILTKIAFPNGREKCSRDTRTLEYVNHAFQVVCLLTLSTCIRILNRPIGEQKYYIIARRSHDNSENDVTSLYSHWSVLSLNVEEVDKQLEKHGIYTWDHYSLSQDSQDNHSYIISGHLYIKHGTLTKNRNENRERGKREGCSVVGLGNKDIH